MFKLRGTKLSVTDVCFEFGFGSLGTFGRTFREIVGQTPIEYRAKAEIPQAPTCFTMDWTRPSSFGEARATNGQ